MTPEERATEIYNLLGDNDDVHREEDIFLVASIIKAAIREEREACAKIADQVQENAINEGLPWRGGRTIATSIRSRK